jgi:outer membrane protein TolC
MRGATVIRSSLVLFISLSAAQARAAEPVSLTAAEVARRTTAVSPTARARAYDSQAAAAAVDQARAAYVPRLSTSLRYTRLSPMEQASLGTLVAAPGANPGPLPAGSPLVAVPLRFEMPDNQYVGTASLSVPLSDYLWRLPALTDAARAGSDAARLVEQASRLRVATDAQTTYYAWMRARLQLDVTRQSLSQSHGHLNDVREAEKAGSASSADRLRVEAQVSAAELLVARTETLVLTLDRQLRALMHDQSGSAYEIGESLPEVTPAAAPAEAALVDEALGRRLEPKVFGAQSRAARKQASAARAAGLPRLDAVAGAVYARPNQRVFPAKDEFRGTWDASLVLSWNPTDLFATEAAHRAASARADSAAAEGEGVADAIRVEVAQTLQATREADTAIASAARGLTAAEESYRVRRLLFQNGRATSVELTDAETALLRARLEAVSARIDRRVAQVRLEHAVGRDVSGQ